MRTFKQFADATQGKSVPEILDEVEAETRRQERLTDRETNVDSSQETVEEKATRLASTDPNLEAVGSIIRIKGGKVADSNSEPSPTK